MVLTSVVDAASVLSVFSSEEVTSEAALDDSTVSSGFSSGFSSFFSGSFTTSDDAETSFSS